MAGAIKIPVGATHTIVEARQDYVSLLLTQQEANWLCGKLENYSFTERDCWVDNGSQEVDVDPEPIGDSMIRSKIFNALLPVTQP